MSSERKEKSNREVLIQDFLIKHGWGDAERVPMPQGASVSRNYERLKREIQISILPDTPRPRSVKPFTGMTMESAILMDQPIDAPPPPKSINDFLKIARYLKYHGITAPTIIAEDTIDGFLILEDFGDTTFNKALQGEYSDKFEETLYRNAVNVLIALHKQPPPPDLPIYDTDEYLTEVMELPDWYLPLIGVTVSEEQKEEYKQLWLELIPQFKTNDDVLVLRDYIADNLMWIGEKRGIDRVGVLDIQDALLGPSPYDLVSILEDARRDVPKELAEKMLNYYMEMSATLDRDKFITSYYLLAAQRNCKIIGRFARLSSRDNKHEYLDFLPRVWRYLDNDLKHPKLKNLKNWINDFVPEGIKPIVPEEIEDICDD